VDDVSQHGRPVASRAEIEYLKYPSAIGEIHLPRPEVYVILTITGIQDKFRWGMGQGIVEPAALKSDDLITGVYMSPGLFKHIKRLGIMDPDADIFQYMAACLIYLLQVIRAKRLKKRQTYSHGDIPALIYESLP
jgi:hypothetical protein